MIVCLCLPYFASTIERRYQSASVPLLIARYTAKRSKVIAVSEEAEQLGIERGMTLSRARALSPEAQVVPIVPSRYRHALYQLLTLLAEYSQWVDYERDYAQTAVVYLDLGKLKPSIGLQLGQQMGQQLRERCGLTAQVGLAANKFTAYAAAVTPTPEQVKLIPRGEEAAFLAALSVQILPLDGQTAHRLHLFGLRSLGQLAALPRDALIAQFGKTGGMLHRLASGEDTRRVARYLPEQIVSESFTFEPAINDRLMLGHLLHHLSQRLAAQLEAQNLTCREVILTLSQEHRGQLEERMRLREPKDSALVIYRAAQGVLARMVVSSSISSVDLRLAHLAPTLPRQLSLFEESAPQKLQAVLLDLAEHYGTDRFYTATVNPHAALPELRFWLEGIDVA